MSSLGDDVAPGGRAAVRGRRAEGAGQEGKKKRDGNLFDSGGGKSNELRRSFVPSFR